MTTLKKAIIDFYHAQNRRNGVGFSGQLPTDDMLIMEAYKTILPDVKRIRKEQEEQRIKNIIENTLEDLGLIEDIWD